MNESYKPLPPEMKKLFDDSEDFVRREVSELAETLTIPQLVQVHYIFSALVGKMTDQLKREFEKYGWGE